MKRRLLTVATLTPVGALGVSGLALAVWSVASTGATGTAAADTLAAPQTVSTTNVSTSSVTVNVTVGPSSGPTPTGYRVDRTAPSSATGVCTITGSTGSCVDASPVSGQTNTYAVRSLLGTSWVSGTGATASANVPSSDTTAPTTTATPSPTPNGAGWNNANVTVALAATDNSGGSGVKQITYSASGAQTIVQTTVSGASANVGITTEGTTTISYFATDNANNVEGTKTVTINLDKSAPTVTGVTSTLANGSYKAGQVVPVTVTFSESVTVTGTPQLSLSTGSPATTVVSYVSGSGTSTLTFNYTVAAGNSSADLDYASAAALALNGGTIRDIASNSATLTLPAPGAAGSLSANKNLVIDTTAPTLTSVVAVNGKTLGQIDHAGTNRDTLTFTYSDTNGINPSSVIAAWNGTGSQSITVTFTDGGAGNDSISVPGIGTVNLGSTSWLTTTSTQTEQLTFTSPNTFVLTIINDPTGNGSGVAASNFTWSATGGTAADPAGNSATGSATTNTQRF